MTKTVLCILCLIVAVFAVSFNNLGSNAHAQELQCPEISGFKLKPTSEEYFRNLVCNYSCDDASCRGDAGIEAFAYPKDEYVSETCQEFQQRFTEREIATRTEILFERNLSTTHYATSRAFGSWINENMPARFYDVRDAAIDVLRQIENSGLATPCEYSGSEFDKDSPPTTCPADYPYLWSDGYCYDQPESDSGTCPADYPYLWSDGSCYDQPESNQSDELNQKGNDLLDLERYVKAMSTAANQLLESGDYQGALTGYDKILEADSNNFIALFGKGIALGNLGRNEEALVAYEKAIEIEPGEYGLWVNKGLVLNNLGRYTEGLKAEEKAIEIDPNSQQAWVNKAVSLEGLGRYDEALDAYDKTLEINPNNEFAINNKNNLLDKIQGKTSKDSQNGGGCLIATAIYGSELAPQVQFLREIRDDTVLSTASGTSFMTAFNAFYYSFSPTVADLERQSPVFKEMVRVAITPLLSTLSLLQYVDIDSEAEMLGYGIGIIIMNIGMYFVAPTVAIVKVGKLFKNKKDKNIVSISIASASLGFR